MQQNAYQIQKVVKETFTGQSFERRAMISDCSQEKSDGETISCMWSEVTHAVQSPNQANTAGALRTLIAVSVTRS